MTSVIISGSRLSSKNIKQYFVTLQSVIKYAEPGTTEGLEGS